MNELYKIDDVQYMVSLYCPGRCRNCNVWQRKKEEVTKGEIDLVMFERVLQSDALKNVSHFELTAGESQLSPKYVDVVKLIARYKPDAVVHTNISGWYPQRHFEVTKECVRYIKPSLFKIDISLDGRPENYKSIRFIEDGFYKAVETAKLLKQLNIPIRFIMTTFKEIYRDIEWFVSFAKEMGVGYYIGYPRISTFYFKNIDKEFNFTKKEIAEIENLLSKVGWLTERRLANWLWAKSVYEKNTPFFECYMGRMSIVIDPYGNVYPCNELLPELFMGNLKEFGGDLDMLLLSEKAVKVIEYVKERKCQPCGMLCALKIEFPWGKQAGLIPIEKDKQ
ncbi:radical SAM protein [Dissulfurispira sp.]|uniref:radical SAM protein n=1 Tax=Dissulfurispira sp. TaxID=2817609 RepID=UPI002FD984C8